MSLIAVNNTERYANPEIRQNEESNYFVVFRVVVL